MLPLVLGGIALAAVGYGVKEFCEEEGCPWDDESKEPEKKMSCNDYLYREKLKFYEVLHLRYLPVVSQIEGYTPKALKYPHASFIKENIPVNSALQNDACNYTRFIVNSRLKLESCVDRLEISINSTVNDSDSIQNDLSFAEKLIRKTSKLCHRKMLGEEKV